MSEATVLFSLIETEVLLYSCNLYIALSHPIHIKGWVDFQKVPIFVVSGELCSSFNLFTKRLPFSSVHVTFC